MNTERNKEDRYYKYFMVASEPVRVTMRIIDEKHYKAGAEILDKDQDNKVFKFDNTYLTDITGGSEVTEIDQETFERYVRSIQETGKLPPAEFGCG